MTHHSVSRLFVSSVIAFSAFGTACAQNWPAWFWQVPSHANHVNSSSFSSDGKEVVSGSDDGTVRIWRTGDGVLVHSLTGNNNRVLTARFTRDDKLIVSGCVDGSLRVWDPVTGLQVANLTGTGGIPYVIEFSNDGQYMVTAFGDGSVRLHRTSDWGLVRVFTGLPAPCFSAAVSPDGLLVAGGSADGSVRVWHLSDGSLQSTIAAHTGEVRGLDFSPDSHFLASAATDRYTKMWRLSDNSLSQTFFNNGEAVYSVDFSPNGQNIVTAANTMGWIWRVSDGVMIKMLQGHGGETTEVRYSPDGQQITSAERYSNVNIWNSSDGSLVHWLGYDTLDGTASFAFSPDGTRFIGGGYYVHVYDTASQQSLYRLDEGQSAPVAASPDGSTFACGSGQRIYFHNLSDGSTIRFIQAHNGGVLDLAYSPDGTKMASSATEPTAKLWDLTTGSLLHVLTGHTNYVQSVAWSPDGQQVTTGSWDATAKVWNVATGALVRTLTHPDKVYSVAYSPNGQVLATACWDGNVRLFKVSDGSLIGTLVGHTGRVFSVAFSPSGNVLASASQDDKTIRLWNPTTGQLLGVLDRQTKKLVSVKFSPDGSLLAIGGDVAGLATWNPGIVCPDSVAPAMGRVTGGDAVSLASLNGQGLVMCKFLVPNQVVDAVQFDVQGVCNVQNPVGIALNVRSKMLNTGAFRQSLQLWDWANSRWDPVDTDSAVIGTAWLDRKVTATGALGRYVSDGRVLRMHASIGETGLSSVSLWCYEADFIHWEVKAF